MRWTKSIEMRKRVVINHLDRVRGRRRWDNKNNIDQIDLNQLVDNQKKFLDIYDDKMKVDFVENEIKKMKEKFNSYNFEKKREEKIEEKKPEEIKVMDIKVVEKEIVQEEVVNNKPVES